MKIAVCIQIYYQEFWDYIIKMLGCIHEPFDLYVSLMASQNTDYIQKRFLEFNQNTIFVFCENRGCDVGPFISSIWKAEELGKTYDLVLKLHTKKRIKKWRDDLYNALVINNKKCLELFKDKTIGMVGDTIKSMDLEDKNIDNYVKLCSKHKIINPKGKYIAGTMFWMRYNLIRDFIVNNKITINDFEYGYEEDGLLAHSFERLFGDLVDHNRMYIEEINSKESYIRI